MDGGPHQTSMREKARKLCRSKPDPLLLAPDQAKACVSATQGHNHSTHVPGIHLYDTISPGAPDYTHIWNGGKFYPGSKSKRASR